MNIHIAEPRTSRATRVLALIGLLTILFVILFAAVRLIQFSFPEHTDSPAAVIESQDRVSEEEYTPEEPEVVITEPEVKTEEPEVVEPPVYVPQYTDLEIKIQTIGFLSGNTLIPSTVIDSNIRGGIQFAVKNIGTRYSNTWTLAVDLPNGETYRLSTQPGLAAGETAFITISFDPEGRDGTYIFDARITSYGESTDSNNYIRGSMTFVD